MLTAYVKAQITKLKDIQFTYQDLPSSNIVNCIPEVKP